MADGDTVTVYVSTTDPRESSFVPGNVHTAAVQRAEARAQRDYANADAFHQQIIDSGYRLVCSFLILYVNVSNLRYRIIHQSSHLKILKNLVIHMI